MRKRGRGGLAVEAQHDLIVFAVVSTTFPGFSDILGENPANRAQNTPSSENRVVLAQLSRFHELIGG